MSRNHQSELAKDPSYQKAMRHEYRTYDLRRQGRMQEAEKEYAKALEAWAIVSKLFGKGKQ